MLRFWLEPNSPIKCGLPTRRGLRRVAIFPFRHVLVGRIVVEFIIVRVEKVRDLAQFLHAFGEKVVIFRVVRQIEQHQVAYLIRLEFGVQLFAHTHVAVPIRLVFGVLRVLHVIRPTRLVDGRDLFYAGIVLIFFEDLHEYGKTFRPFLFHLFGDAHDPVFVGIVALAQKMFFARSPRRRKDF